MICTCSCALAAQRFAPPSQPRPAGEASAIFKRAEASAKGLQLLADAIRQQGGSEAVSLRVAEQYLDGFKEIAQRGTTMLLPASVNE